MVPDKDQPWWNDGDKVSGLLATIIMLTVTIALCMVLLWGLGKWLW